MDGMEPPKDGGFNAPPPPDGLGNYKGVMLCNRPVEESQLARMRAGAADGGNPPFKSMISSGERDQPGLPPCKKLEPRSIVKTRGSSAALRRHMQWIKELQVQVADEHQRIDDDAQLQNKRKQQMQVLFKEQRDAIKDLKSSGFQTMADVRKLESHLDLKAKSEAKGKSRAPKKPLWAMTEEEKEGAEDDEALGLIDFAENLDFEKYLGDAEFRQCLQVVQDRANRLQREQDKFKDDLIRDFNAQATSEDGDEFCSAYTGSPRESQVGDLPSRRPVGASRDGRPDWDGSSAMGDDRQVDREARSDAGRVLDAMPQLKGVHSQASVQRLIEKAREGTPVT
jgi:hypothetical protein